MRPQDLLLPNTQSPKGGEGWCPETQVYPCSRESDLKSTQETTQGEVVTVPIEAALGSKTTRTVPEHSPAMKGYSLYSRQVSLTPDGIPVPSGTSTPSRVMLAEGSGAVLPKPVRWKGQVLGITGGVEMSWVYNIYLIQDVCVHSKHPLDASTDTVKKGSKATL